MMEEISFMFLASSGALLDDEILTENLPEIYFINQDDEQILPENAIK